MAELKKSFTVDDIYQRARRVLELAVRHGCTAMRAHVEIDAFVELRGVEAMRRLQADLAGVLDLELIAFAQEGIFHDGVTKDLLREALKAGLERSAAVRTWTRDQRAHIDWFFETAQAFGVPLDFHADSVGRSRRCSRATTSPSRRSRAACRAASRSATSACSTCSSPRTARA